MCNNCIRIKVTPIVSDKLTTNIGRKYVFIHCKQCDSYYSVDFCKYDSATINQKFDPSFICTIVFYDYDLAKRLYNNNKARVVLNCFANKEDGKKRFFECKLYCRDHIVIEI